MKANFDFLLFLGSVFLTAAFVGLAANTNPYYIESFKFTTQFENNNGTIQILPQFQNISQHLQFLQSYRIVKYTTKPNTVVLPHHSDAEHLLIVTKGSAVVKVYTEGDDKIPPLVLNQFDAIRVPAGAISYTINTGGSNGTTNLEFIELAIPLKIPGQFKNLYPAGYSTPSSFYKVFRQKTLTAAFNATYSEIQTALWGTSQWTNEAIVGLSSDQLNNLTKDAQSSSSEDDIPLTSLGPIPLSSITPLYTNKYGSFHEALPQTKYTPLNNLTIGVNFLNLTKGSMFLPHYNRKAVIVAYVAEGDGFTELGSPYPINNQTETQPEGYIEKLSATVGEGDIFVIPAGHPTAVSAVRDSKLKVVEFMLNALDNNRIFLIGDGENVVKNIDPVLLSKTPEALKKLLAYQSGSYFAKRESSSVSGLSDI